MLLGLLWDILWFWLALQTKTMRTSRQTQPQRQNGCEQCQQQQRLGCRWALGRFVS